MSIYFITSSVQSKHYKGANSNNIRPANANNTIPNMPNGFPAFPQSRFPNEEPPTLFHPASAKTSDKVDSKDLDAASMASTSTFASTVGLLKENVKAKLHSKSRKAQSPKVKESPSPPMTDVYMAMSMNK